MSIHDDLATIENDLAQGAQVAGEFMLDLIRRARAEFSKLASEAEAVIDPAPAEPEPEPKPEPAPVPIAGDPAAVAVADPVPVVAVDPSSALALPLADAEPLTDLHGDPVPLNPAPPAPGDA